MVVPEPYSEKKMNEYHEVDAREVGSLANRLGSQGIHLNDEGVTILKYGIRGAIEEKIGGENGVMDVTQELDLPDIKVSVNTDRGQQEGRGDGFLRAVKLVPNKSNGNSDQNSGFFDRLRQYFDTVKDYLGDDNHYTPTDELSGRLDSDKTIREVRHNCLCSKPGEDSSFYSLIAELNYESSDGVWRKEPVLVTQRASFGQIRKIREIQNQLAE